LQGKAKPRPPLHAGLIPVKTCSTFILSFFPMIPGGYLMDITGKFLKEDECFEK
jgi:hypothetical protein